MSNDTPASVIGEGVGYSAVARLEALELQVAELRERLDQAAPIVPDPWDLEVADMAGVEYFDLHQMHNRAEVAIGRAEIGAPNCSCRPTVARARRRSRRTVVALSTLRTRRVSCAPSRRGGKRTGQRRDR